HLDIAALVIPAPSISAPARVAGTAGSPLTVSVTSSHPTGIPALSAQAPLPAGASFADHGDGTGTLSWTPTAAASVDVTFVATFAGINALASTHLDIAALVIPTPGISAPARVA